MADAAVQAGLALRALPREQRVAPIARAFSDRVAATLGVPADAIDIEAPFWQLAPALRDVPMRWRLLIEPWVKEYLGLRQFHLYEASLSDSIAELAGYLAGELDPVPIPVDAFDEHNSSWQWGWSDPTPFRGDAQVRGNTAFVLGAGRSGTSLFRTMLSCHERVHAPNELHLLNFDDMGQRRADMRRLWQQWMDVGLVETLRSQFDMTEWEAVLEIRKFADASLPIAEVYERIQAKLAGRWLVDKTPAYARHPAWLERAEQMFVGPSYLFMTRHPYAVMDSFMNSRFHRFSAGIWGTCSSNPWHAAEIYWTETNRNILAFLKRIPASRWMRVSYEGLMRDTDKTLGEICQFLAIPYDSGMADPYRSGISVTGYLTDRNRVEHGLAEAWRDKRPSHPLSPLTRQVAEELGYPLA